MNWEQGIFTTLSAFLLLSSVISWDAAAISVPSPLRFGARIPTPHLSDRHLRVACAFTQLVEALARCGAATKTSAPGGASHAGLILPP